MEKQANIELNEELMMKIASGDDQAFTDLYYATYKQIYGFLLSLTKNKEDAEDLMQNTFIKVRNGAHLYKPQGTVMSWMCAIAKNQFLDFARKYGKNRPVDFGEVENYVSESYASHSNEAEQVENRMLLETVFSILDEQERVIVTMHMLDGLKHREIADVIGMPLSTVITKYNRSLKKMKKVVER